MASGKLIVFEGVDATGKTTLCDDLFHSLIKRGLPAIELSFPGDLPGTLGELVYRIHHQHEDEFNVSSINPCSIQLLHIASHIDTIESIIKPAVYEGKWVILDRYWWSTYVYGIDSGVHEELLELMIELEKKVWGALLPEVVFLIDSASPLRNDEDGCSARQKKRQLYTKVKEKHANEIRCICIETALGQSARESANELMIKELLQEKI